MRGKHKLIVSNNKVRYEIELKRNITIIQGDSGTGKTTLIKLIMLNCNGGRDSGVRVECDKKCVFIAGINWELTLENTKDSIVFIDEENRFLYSREFAVAVQNSDNYYVIVTREGLSQIPYSYKEIYHMEIVGKHAVEKQVYNGLIPEYYGGSNRSNSLSKLVKPTLIITEDSNAGYEFFSEVSKKIGIKCISANGKSNIAKCIIDRPGEVVLIIADGAAYGPEIKKTLKELNKRRNYYLYLPESFEYLVLESGLFRGKGIEDRVNDPIEYIESGEYFSWERFFTSLLEEVSENDPRTKKYSKNGKLDKFYKNEYNMKKILDCIRFVKFD